MTPVSPVTAGPPKSLPGATATAAFKPEVPIQDGATIDFSIGAPVVRSGGPDTEALDRALKEMADATKNVTFPPPPPKGAASPPKK